MSPLNRLRGGGTCRCLSLFMMGTLLLVGFLHSAAAAEKRNGNELLSACTLAMSIVDSPQAIEQMLGRPHQALEAGYCLGLLHAVTNINAFWQHYPKDTSMFFCLPPQSTVNQWTRIVVKYLQEHPERLQEADIGLAIRAFTTAFPCPSKIQSPRR
jgi:Rap1a immunity proteins